MTKVERGSVIIIEGTNISREFQQGVTNETGCRIICLDPTAGERVVAVIPPEPVTYVADYDTGMITGKTNEEKLERVIRSMGGEHAADTDEKFPVVPDDIRKRAERAADMIGVTKHSEMRFHVVHAAICALTYDDTKYLIGDETMKKVFMPVGMVNLSNLQWFLDEVERALQPKPAVEPENQLSAVQLHRAAIEAHTEAEKYADAISALPDDFQSEGREMMLNEYFERQRKAIAASRKTDIQGEGIPDHDGPRIWNDRSMWHYKLKGRHAQILRILTDQ